MSSGSAKEVASVKLGSRTSARSRLPIAGRPPNVISVVSISLERYGNWRCHKPAVCSTSVLTELAVQVKDFVSQINFFAMKKLLSNSSSQSPR